MNYRTFFVMLIVGVLFAISAPLSAQQPPGKTVTDDDVNAIAKKMYCPVCENIPLDACGTAACAQWRGDIRDQLAAGKTEEQIIADFVKRFGDRVVGVPEDPALNALSLITPWLISLVALIGGGLVVVRWRANRLHAVGLVTAPAAGTSNHAAMSEDEYRARLEADLRQRR